ncbi:MAG: hypothetical protein ABFD49_06345 [Armatimonadota bacterium]|nr:YjbH domain-containing protein [bacterium]
MNGLTISGGLLALLLFGSASHAMKQPAPQYVNVAPLPGSGMALDSDGKPDGAGAMQINIPVAYTPGKDYVELSAYAGQFVNDNKSDPNWKNGTGTIGFGFGTWPRFYGSGMAVSSLIFDDSKVLSAQLQIVKESGATPAIAIGAQDILNKEEADFGDTCNTGVGYYGVATKNVHVSGKSVYVTAGYGAGRFLDRPFGGVSVPVNNYISLATEYDGFQINTAAGWRPYGRYSCVTVSGGYNGQTGWVLGAHTTGKMNGIWAIPVTIMLLRR